METKDWVGLFISCWIIGWGLAARARMPFSTRHWAEFWIFFGVPAVVLSPVFVIWVARAVMDHRRRYPRNKRPPRPDAP